MSGLDLDRLRRSLSAERARPTRFGGLKLLRCGWQFDVWPLERTWAFVRDGKTAPHFRELPATTFFNVEAIAIELWPQEGKPRNVYAGDGQFFEGIVNRTLELNREENPFPGLCVVRSFVMAARLGFAMGNRICQYVIEHGALHSAQDLENIQCSHYGAVRFRGVTLKRALARLESAASRGRGRVRQLLDGTTLLARL